MAGRIPVLAIAVGLCGAGIIAGSFGPWSTGEEGFATVSQHTGTWTAILGALVVAGAVFGARPEREWPLGLTILPSGLALAIGAKDWIDLATTGIRGLGVGPGWGLLVVAAAAAVAVLLVLIRVFVVFFETLEDDAPGGGEN